MKRLCVIGNSHAACFKLASDASPQAEVALTFFASRHNWGLKQEGDKLVPGKAQLADDHRFTSGGLTEIDPSQYDAILLIGLGVLSYPLEERYLSQAALRQWLIDFTPHTLGFALAKLLRKASDVPVFVAHQPLLSYDGVECDDGVVQYRRQIAILSEIFRPMRTIVLEQPETTVTNLRYTKQEYSTRAPRLNIGEHRQMMVHTERDREHMNSSFATLCLEAIVPLLTSRAISRAPAAAE